MVRRRSSDNSLAQLPEPVANLPSAKVCERARRSRDVRFDGRFFVAVLTTGIYCRPVCPARIPAEDNVRYYASAAAAQDAGYRPCMRCLPQTVGRPEWTLSSDTVLRALRYLEAGYLNERTSGELAAELGVGERQLGRLFSRELGATPGSIARILRARSVRELMRNADLSMVQVAHHAGFGSVSRFNHEVRAVYGMTPSALRGRLSRHAAVADPELKIVVKLPVRQPYDFDWVFRYLAKRALRGTVTGAPGSWCYARVLRPQSAGVLGQTVYVAQEAEALRVTIPTGGEPVYKLVSRVRRLFDLSADGQHIHAALKSDSQLGRWVRRAPGLRVPGAWDGFETAVRAVLGQQVSVDRGTVLADKMCVQYGAGYFPLPEQLKEREIAELGMPGRRGRAISHIARLVDEEELTFNERQDADRLYEALVSIEGLGPWTANYIRMRVCKDPDAFPDNDWVVLKQLQLTPAKARQLADAWRPWRAYALMYIWFASNETRVKTPTKNAAK